MPFRVLVLGVLLGMGLNLCFLATVLVFRVAQAQVIRGCGSATIYVDSPILPEFRIEFEDTCPAPTPEKYDLQVSDITNLG